MPTSGRPISTAPDGRGSRTASTTPTGHTARRTAVPAGRGCGASPDATFTRRPVENPSHGFAFWHGKDRGPTSTSRTGLTGRTRFVGTVARPTTATEARVTRDGGRLTFRGKSRPVPSSGLTTGLGGGLPTRLLARPGLRRPVTPRKTPGGKGRRGRVGRVRGQP